MFNKKIDEGFYKKFGIITIIIFLLIDIPLLIYTFNFSNKDQAKPVSCMILERDFRYRNWHLHLAANISNFWYENWVRANDRTYHDETEKIDCYYKEGKSDSLSLWQPLSWKDILYILYCVPGQIILFGLIVGITYLLFYLYRKFFKLNKEILAKLEKSDICQMCFEKTQFAIKGCNHYLCEKCENRLREKPCPYCRAEYFPLLSVESI